MPFVRYAFWFRYRNTSTCKIIQNSKIEGITVGSHEIKITQYADDTTVFLRNQELMNVLLELLENFERCSGLKVRSDMAQKMEE